MLREWLGTWSVASRLISMFSLLVVAAVALAGVAMVLNWRTEREVEAITKRVVKIERPTRAERDAATARAVKSLSRHNTRALMNRMLRNMTPRQKARLRGPRGFRGRTIVIGRSPTGSSRTAARRRSSARRLAPARSPTLDLGEQIRRSTCAQIHRAMPQAVC